MESGKYGVGGAEYVERGARCGARSGERAVRRHVLLPIERVAATYCALTCLLMMVLMPRLVDPAGMLLMRVEWLGVTLALVLVQRLLTTHSAPRTPHLAPRTPYPAPRTPHPVLPFLRIGAQLAWLAKWYPDTYEFNRCFPNLDHVFAQADQTLFGCQPALEFSRALPQAFWSEAFNLGYWSYFPMIIMLVVVLFYKEWRPAPPTPHSAPRTPHTPLPTPHSALPTPYLVSTTLLVAFFLYYAVYIFLPVAGPQFYYQAVGVEDIAVGHFPALGSYFSAHTEMLTAPGYADGLFYNLVSGAQAAGERPTAAFPSSHVGVSTILLLLSRRHAPRLTWVLLPLWALLYCATVYIQAHYLVDAIAGLLTAPLALYAATWVARRVRF